jgi:hypothetical protein
MIRQSHVTRICFALCSIFAVQQAYGHFTTVLNIPPDPDIDDVQMIGSDTQLNLKDGGVIGRYFEAGAFDGTSADIEVNISGGSVDRYFKAYDGSVVNISGGSVAVAFRANSGSEVNISGGSVDESFNAFSEVNISGGSVGDFFWANTGSVVNLSNGSVDDFLDANSGSVVNISGGTVGSFLDAKNGSVVNLSGGTVGNFVTANSGSVVNLSGSSVGSFFNANSGSVVNISDGSVGRLFAANSGSEVNISGGSVGDFFCANSGSEVNLFGTEYMLDSIDITAMLTPNIPHTVNYRNVTLSGLLDVGFPFSFNLDSESVIGKDYFDSSALLTITLMLPGDFDGDGIVDGEDFLLWQRDPTVGLLSVWEANYGMGVPFSEISAAVPEPTTFTLALAALCLAMSRRGISAR